MQSIIYRQFCKCAGSLQFICMHFCHSQHKKFTCMTFAESKRRSLSESALLSEVPAWLSPKSVVRVIKPEPCSDNRHGIMTPDHIDVKWPLPTMFGSEQYAFSLIDIPEPRFAEETAVMSRKLIRLFYDYQIIEHEWRKTYKQFIEAEKRKANLVPGVLQKSRDKAEAAVESAREQLLRLQDQRDLFDSVISKIWDRCSQIRATINKEKELEALREDLSQGVRDKFPQGDPFWKGKFKVRMAATTPALPGKHHSKHK